MLGKRKGERQDDLERERETEIETERKRERERRYVCSGKSQRVKYEKDKLVYRE